MLLTDELQSIISGTGQVTKGAAIQAVAGYLRKSKAAGANPQEKEFLKEQEAAAILEYARLHHFLFTGFSFFRGLPQSSNK